MMAMTASKISKFILSLVAVLALSLTLSGSANAGLLGGVGGLLGGVTGGVNSGGGGNINIPGLGGVNIGAGGGGGGINIPGLGGVNLGNGGGAGTVNIPGLGTVGLGANGGNVTIPGVGTFNTNGSGQVTIPGIGTFSFGNGGWSFGTGGLGGCAAGGLGSVICNVVQSSSQLPFLLSGIAYLAGLVLGVMAIIKLKDHVLNPDRTPLSDSIKRFLAGGAFFALPIVLTAAYNTVATGINPAAQTGFNITGGTGVGLSAMVTALMADIWQPMTLLIGGFCYLAGVALIIIGISRLLKTAQEGPRGPAGMGTIMTFLVGGALLSADAMMGAFTGSFFADGTTHTFGVLAYAQGLGNAAAHAHDVLAAILAFMMIVGWISFVRGWFIIREVAEGNHQASLMAGMTHIFGGALAVNLGPALMAIQTTFGLQGLGIVFT